TPHDHLRAGPCAREEVASARLADGGDDFPGLRDRIVDIAAILPVHLAVHDHRRTGPHRSWRLVDAKRCRVGPGRPCRGRWIIDVHRGLAVGGPLESARVSAPGEHLRAGPHRAEPRVRSGRAALWQWTPRVLQHGRAVGDRTVAYHRRVTRAASAVT